MPVSFDAVAWGVILQVKGGYRIHSVHKNRAIAEEWCRCILHDGEFDCSILELDSDAINSVSDLLEAK